jgi:hypothetical protein
MELYYTPACLIRQKKPKLQLIFLQTHYLIVEHERVRHRLTWRQLKRQLILKGPQTSLPSLEQLRMAAQVLSVVE